MHNTRFSYTFTFWSAIPFNPLWNENHSTGTLTDMANSEDQAEMPHNVAFYQGLHCLLRQNRSSEKEIQYIVGNYNMWPRNINNTMDHPNIVACSFMETFIGLKRFNLTTLKDTFYLYFQLLSPSVTSLHLPSQWVLLLVDLMFSLLYSTNFHLSS